MDLGDAMLIELMTTTIDLAVDLDAIQLGDEDHALVASAKKGMIDDDGMDRLHAIANNALPALIANNALPALATTSEALERELEEEEKKGQP